MWACGTVVKSPFGMPTSQIEVPGIFPKQFASDQLLANAYHGRQQIMTEEVGSLS